VDATNGAAILETSGCLQITPDNCLGFTSKNGPAGTNFIPEINNRDLAQVVVGHEQKNPRDVRVENLPTLA
jgi:hypothetical protein